LGPVAGRKGVGAHSPTSPATPNLTGQSPRAAVQISNARAQESRRNGAKSRGPKTLEGKARSAQNALKHGLRAEKYVVLPEEDAAESAGHEPSSAEQRRPALRYGTDRRSEPNEPDWHAGRRFENVGPEPPTSGRALHEAPASWTPNEPWCQPAGRRTRKETHRGRTNPSRTRHLDPARLAARRSDPCRLPQHRPRLEPTCVQAPAHDRHRVHAERRRRWRCAAQRSRMPQ
jgi:hypothetical protein